MQSVRIVNRLSKQDMKERVYRLERDRSGVFYTESDERDEQCCREEWLDYLEALDTGNDIIEISITKIFLCR